MKLGARRILFYSLVLLFALMGTGVTLYAQGYRFDTAARAVRKVGAAYVVSSPSDADISFDGTPVARTNGLFERGTLVGNLFPSSHVVELSKEGYRPWTRRVAVESAKVAEVYATLVPETASSSYEGDANRFWVLNGNLVAERRNGTLTLLDAVLPVRRPLGWTKNRKGFLGQDKARVPVFYDLERATSTPMKPMLDRIGKDAYATSTMLAVDEESDSSVFVVAAHNIVAVDPVRKTLASLGNYPTSTVGAIAASRARIAWTVMSPASSTSRIVLYDRFLRRAGNAAGVIPGAASRLAWGGEERLGILTARGDLFIYDLGSHTLSEQSRDVREFAWNGDGTMLAAIGAQGLEIFSLERNGYARFNLADAVSINSLEWYRDGRNLFLHYPDRVAFLNIDDALLENVTPVATTGYGVYVPEENAFYFTTAAGVSVLRFPSG